MQPVRLQRSRAKGARLTSPNGLPIVCVTRPGIFGNPFFRWDGDAVVRFRRWLTGKDQFLDYFWMLAGHKQPMLAESKAKNLIERRDTVLKRLPELRGKNLACWCGPNDTCHADVLLELANAF